MASPPKRSEIRFSRPPPPGRLVIHSRGEIEPIVPPDPPIPESLVEIQIFPANWVTGPAAVEMGLGGSTHRPQYFRVIGPNDYFKNVQNDGSSANDGAGVDCGVDPAEYMDELDGFTPVTMQLPAGFVSAAARAEIVAASMRSRSWCNDVSVAANDNANGSRSIFVRGYYDNIEVGSITASEAGDAGVFGSHVFRRGQEVFGYADVTLTANVMSAIATPPADAYIWAVSILLGQTVGSQPRLFLRVGGVADGTGSVLLYDFGLVPLSQIVAGNLAMITLTPQQTIDLRAALDTVGAQQLWICAKCDGGVQFAAFPTGGPWGGQLANLPIRVDDLADPNPDQPPDGAWNTTQSFPVLLSARLHYEVEPAGNGESYPVIGSLRDLSGFPDQVQLPNSETWNAWIDEGHRGAQIDHVDLAKAAGPIRFKVSNGGDTSIPPDMTGAVTYYDFGSTSATGVVTYTAPTGNSSRVISPSSSFSFKGTDSIGIGATDPLPQNTAIQPNDFIARSGDDDINGHAVWEIDFPTISGNPATTFEPVITPAQTAASFYPDNLPAVTIGLRRPADVVIPIYLAAA